MYRDLKFPSTFEQGRLVSYCHDVENKNNQLIKWICSNTVIQYDSNKAFEKVNLSCVVENEKKRTFFYPWMQLIITLIIFFFLFPPKD